MGLLSDLFLATLTCLSPGVGNHLPVQTMTYLAPKQADVHGR